MCGSRGHARSRNRRFGAKGGSESMDSPTSPVCVNNPMMAPEPSELSILERRRIEAGIVKPIYEALKAELGIETAQRIIRDAIKRTAVEAGKAFAEREPAGTSMRAFARLLPMWTKGDALEIKVLQETDKAFDYDVHRCRYAEMYREMGLEEIGHLLSCNRDGSLCEGYDARLKLTRTQTIMQGASHCDFRYRFEEDGE